MHFAELPQLVAAGDLLVFNDTRVIKARLFGQKESGGQVEVMIERVIDACHAIAQIRASKPPRAGSRICVEKTFSLRVTGRAGEQSEFYTLELVDAGDLYALIETHGHLPLPPYITHAAEHDDETRYQTVFARHEGAVAAPKPSLLFLACCFWWASTENPIRLQSLACGAGHNEKSLSDDGRTKRLCR